MIKDAPIVEFGTPDQSKTIEFKVDITPKLFEMLSGLYSNKARAVVRELLCNAIDSHIDAGRPNDPVEVILPTAEYPSLVIRDYGVGMSQRTVEEIYTRYSKSTKMHDAATTGALGLGSKSPFCYTNMFVLVSVHDGIKSMYNMYINPQRIPSITLISSEESDDDNGVTITIPIQLDDLWRFESELKFVLSHTLSPVKVMKKYSTGEMYREVTIHNTFDELVAHRSGNDVILKTDPWGTSPHRVYILQANVVYPINSAELIGDFHTASIAHRTPVVLLCDNGSVSFTPTREELSLDLETVDYIADRVNKFKTKLQTWARYYGVRRTVNSKTDWKQYPIVQYLYNYSQRAERVHVDRWWSGGRHRHTQKYQHIRVLDGMSQYSSTNLSECADRVPKSIGIIVYGKSKFSELPLTKLRDRMIQGNWVHGKPRFVFRVQTVDDVKRLMRRLKYTGKVEIRSVEVFRRVDPNFSHAIPTRTNVSGANVGVFNGSYFEKCSALGVQIESGDIFFIRDGQDYTRVKNHTIVHNYGVTSYGISIDRIRKIRSRLQDLEQTLTRLITQGGCTNNVNILHELVVSTLSKKWYLLTETQHERLTTKSNVKILEISTIVECMIDIMKDDLVTYDVSRGHDTHKVEPILNMALAYKSHVPEIELMIRKVNVIRSRWNRTVKGLSREARTEMKTMYSDIGKLWNEVYTNSNVKVRSQYAFGINQFDIDDTWPYVEYETTLVEYQLQLPIQDTHRSPSSGFGKILNHIESYIACRMVNQAVEQGLVDDMFKMIFDGMGGINSKRIESLVEQGQLHKLIERLSSKEQ